MAKDKARARKQKRGGAAAKAGTGAAASCTFTSNLHWDFSDMLLVIAATGSQLPVRPPNFGFGVRPASPLANPGSQLVGKSIEVWWGGDGMWFEGEVTAFTAKSGEHHIR